MRLPDIKGFLETSFVDWPGRLASVVFLPGCNFRCPYCHNHRLVLNPGDLATWPLDAILGRLEGFRGWIDGVCVTGGEPTIHDALPEFLTLFRSRGWTLKLDTNGSRPEALRGILSAGLVEAVALDVKAPLEPVPYRRNAGPGSDPEAVAETLRVLADWGGWVDVRATVHPELLSADELGRLAAQAGLALSRSDGDVRFTPQRCRPEEALDPALREKPSLSPEEFSQWAQPAKELFARTAFSRRRS